MDFCSITNKDLNQNHLGCYQMVAKVCAPEKIASTDQPFHLLAPQRKSPTAGSKRSILGTDLGWARVYFHVLYIMGLPGNRSYWIILQVVQMTICIPV